MSLQAIGDILQVKALFVPVSVTAKTCPKHGIEYEEQVFKRFTRGCPKCAEEAEAERQRQEAAKREQQQQAWLRKRAEQCIGDSRIPKRFLDKTVAGYRVENDGQRYIVERVKAYAHEFTQGHSGRCLTLLGNPGTGKTHLACAVGRHVILNCGGQARFASVAEINRIVRESKSFDSGHSESEVIKAFGSYELLIIDEVGVQSGTEAESRALFDVFNERYQNCRPTILISNFDVEGFRDAVGERIADRAKEDGGEVLFFDWESHRG